MRIIIFFVCITYISNHTENVSSLPDWLMAIFLFGFLSCVLCDFKEMFK